MDNTTSTAQHQPRVLYLTKVYPYPPATAGDAVYSRGIIEAVAETCDVTVVCADSGAARRNFSGIIWHVTRPERTGRAKSVMSRWPLIAWKGATAEFHAVLEGLLAEKWDAIVLDNLGLAHALPRAEAYRAAHPNTQLIYVSHEYEYPTRAGKYGSYKMSPLKRFLAGRDLEKVRKSEIALLRRCDIVTFINASDLGPFRNIAPKRKYFSMIPGYSGPVVPDRQITNDTPRRVLLLGGRRSEQKRQILLDWMDAAYAPLTQAGIEMVIVGDMEETLRERLQESFPKTQVLGFVDDLEALIASSRMGLIADTVGGGFKMRLLSHVFERLPIVGLGDAINGLPTNEGEGYLGAQTLTELVELTSEVIDDAERLNRLHATAFEDCEAAFSWRSRGIGFAAAISGGADDVLL